MFEVIPDVGDPQLKKPSTCSLAEGISKIHKQNDGLPCPYGCKGTASRMFGLVIHLMDRHGYSEKSAWRKAGERSRLP